MSRLIPGHAPYKSGDIAYTQEYTFKVTLPDLECGAVIWLQAHAAVVTLVDGEVELGETAYGGDITKPKKGAWYGNIAYTLQCCDVPGNGKCEGETAFGGDIRPSGGGAWWFYFDTTGAECQTIWAGQTINVGTVCITEGCIDITLTGGWKLENVAENVKIQGYYEGELPTRRPAAGQFTTYKAQHTGSTVRVNLGTDYDYYVIHLDVEKCD